MADFGDFDYAFIDKTGTITQNFNEIKALFINSKMYEF